MRKLEKYQKKYCSNKCQRDFQYAKYITGWKSGTINGERGLNTKNISQNIKRYLIERDGARCSQCGWGHENVFSGKVPIEVDHIDGDAMNNAEQNLRLLCPNCHSLTSNYRNLNKGNGRVWRRDKYVKIV
ncbi:HNH endonuclease [Candidatus Saccharibacteria bacterium]|nr:HNH endonuclease [Candidatus Saccharibacteria bacterium]